MLRPLLFCFLLAGLAANSQNRLEKLSVEKIMRDPAWIGTSPSGLQWSQDGQFLFFRWNPDNAPGDSLYHITINERLPRKATTREAQDLSSIGNYIYNQARTAYLFTRDGDVFYVDLKKKIQRRITQTVDIETSPRFSFNESRVVFTKAQNLYSWDIATGELMQLTNLKSAEGSPAGSAGGGNQRGSANRGSGEGNNSQLQEDWMKADQLRWFQVLRERKAKREKSEAYDQSLPKPKDLRGVNIGDRQLAGLTISPDGRFISYSLFRPGGGKATIVPSYVTESGFTTDINGRTKVGAPQSSAEYYFYDRVQDTVYQVSTDSIPGIKDIPDYLKDYPRQLEERKKKNPNRSVSIGAPNWSPNGSWVVLEIRAGDNKDRWLMCWDTAAHRLKLLDRQRDEAWIGGPGIGFGRSGWINDHLFWFQSESTGYSHLYSYDMLTGERKALTSGKFEVQQAQLSFDKKYFYLTTNEVHPGEQQCYRLSLADGKKERITTMTGANQVTISPDEKYLGILYSYSNKPWELYLQENRPGGRIEQITDKAQSEEFRSYAWRDPAIVTFAARDGATVYARLYKPSQPDPMKPAVVFVHGAGYLQNVHKWWSSYFREYMFNNLLADNGYYVLDIDYRGSAGYGRDWRTGIYRHMGGMDLTDQVDGVNWLVKTYGVNPRHVGLYGGSYGGFITLMALFTESETFAAGAGLRSVTDWANYNHGYTSNILNEPFNDSIAYRRSSPLYFAEGLKGRLLMCHGMIDVNVHFQDIVKLSQRLIELGKDGWELAVYPMEDHGFVEPSSWTDEYKRIFRLFEETLRKAD